MESPTPPSPAPVKSYRGRLSSARRIGGEILDREREPEEELQVVEPISRKSAAIIPTSVTSSAGKKSKRASIIELEPEIKTTTATTTAHAPITRSRSRTESGGSALGSSSLSDILQRAESGRGVSGEDLYANDKYDVLGATASKWLLNNAIKRSHATTAAVAHKGAESQTASEAMMQMDTQSVHVCMCWMDFSLIRFDWFDLIWL